MPSNVEDVIGDIENVKGDLRSRIKRNGRRAMSALLATAKKNVQQDADWNGHLQKSLGLDVSDDGDELHFNVHTDASLAPYAALVEFGTGNRTMQTTPRAGSISPPAIGADTRPPPNFPYSAPNMGPNLVSSIIDWVETKPVIPEGDMTEEQLGYVIAAQIVEKGTFAHPFLRPAWFKHELDIESSMVNAVRGAFR